MCDGINISTKLTSHHGIVSTTILNAVNIVDPSLNVFKDVLQECMDIVDVSDHSQLLLALKKYKDRELKINHVVIVTKELHEKQVSVKVAEERLVDVVHATADANPKIMHVINQPHVIKQPPSNGKSNNPRKRQRSMMRKRDAEAASASQSKSNGESSAPSHKRQSTY